VIAGDFFRSVPRGTDAYILKSIIHDWDDERSVTILKNCREAISTDGSLLLIERVMPAQIDASAGHQRWTMMDMHMLVMLGGRERTEDEFQALLQRHNLTAWPSRQFAGSSPWITWIYLVTVIKHSYTLPMERHR
jgi:hypothetical protein